MIGVIIFLAVLLLIAWVNGQVKKIREEEGPRLRSSKEKGIV